MSLLVDVVLFPGSNSAMLDLDEHLNAFGFRGDTFALKRVSQGMRDLAGGNKVLTIEARAASINYLDVDVFVEWLRSIPWKWPTEWVCVVEHEMQYGIAAFWQDGSHGWS